MNNSLAVFHIGESSLTEVIDEHPFFCRYHLCQLFHFVSICLRCSIEHYCLFEIQLLYHIPQYANILFIISSIDEDMRSYPFKSSGIIDVLQACFYPLSIEVKILQCLKDESSIPLLMCSWYICFLFLMLC